MSNEDQFTLVAIDYHRNGVGGNSFHVVLFTDEGVSGTFVATVFEEPGSVAVLNVPLLVEGCVEFARGNSWRGDHFEGWLREQIRDYYARLDAEFNRRHPILKG